PYRGRKGQIWEGGHRVPFLFAWPGQIAAGTVSHTVTLTDIFPTVAAGMGVPLPEGAAVDGVNLLDWLRPDPPSGPVRPATVHVGRAGGHWALRSGPWKLVRLGEEPPLLFNVDTDPGEATDRAAEHPELVTRMSSDLDRYLGGEPTGGSHVR
ncbi:MAG: sulfatase-like hydrolase/transferase, partial [Gemmatimonadetes bacterium]|nr:sulfatase-like hydrolase/transferase [Gemmatimonadota bacterium]